MDVITELCNSVKKLKMSFILSSLFGNWDLGMGVGFLGGVVNVIVYWEGFFLLFFVVVVPFLPLLSRGR